MPQEFALYQVDAFAQRPFTGNPAAVVPLKEWLPDGVLQDIAAENNLSETAFIVDQGKRFALRWFTPEIEVDLCGHATLASGFVINRYLRPGLSQIEFASRSGLLGLTVDGERHTLDFPADPPVPFDVAEQVALALGRRPEAVLRGSKKMLVILESAQDVADAAPDLVKVAALPSDGMIISAPGEDCDFVSRYFAPHAGIPEDPVTGSAHCVSAPYWRGRLGKSQLSARQISKRGGALDLELRGDRVFISGKARLYLEGRIFV